MLISSDTISNKINEYYSKIINMNNRINDRIEFLKELEREYIGTILLDARSALDVKNNLLTINEFQDYRHKLILDACNKLYNSGKEVDIVSVSNLLEENKMLDNAGGRQYINELALLGFERINTILKSKYECN